MARIFVRQRQCAGPGTGRPQFAVVAVEGSDLTFIRSHLRKSELEYLSEAVGAELVYLPMGKEEREGDDRWHRHYKEGRCEDHDED